MRNRQAAMLVAVGLSALLAACTSTKTSAPVVERPAGASRSVQRPPAPSAAVPATPPAAQQRGFYTVRRGDTLMRIAQEFGQNVRDLVAWNNLANGNDIKVDQVLRVLPPDAAPVTSNQAAPVPVAPGVEVRPLQPGSPAAVKNGPRGDKRAYSDAALAEMQRPEGAAPTSQPEPAPAAKAPEKAAEQARTAEDVLDMVWPTDGKVVGAFDPNRKGIDIAGKLGQPVLAAGGGSVLYAGSMRGYGNLVIVRHNSNFLSAYAYNKTILVKEGQTVARGQKIAEMGNSGTDSVKLHFEIRQQGKPVDPIKYLPSR